MPWSPELDRRFAQEENQRISNNDCQACLLLACIWLAGCLSRGVENSSPMGLMLGLWSFSIWLLPWLVYRCSPQRYIRNRRLYVIAFRTLVVLLLPTMPTIMKSLPGGHSLHRRDSGLSLASFLAASAQLVTSWALAICLRLDFKAHLMPHALFTARVVCLEAPAMARVVGSTLGSSALDRVHRVGQIASWFAHLLSPLGPAPGGPQPSAQQYCCALIACTHLLLGFVLPTVAVWTSGKRSRASFVAAEAARLGMNVLEVGPPLGLRLEETMHLALFDPVGAWTLCCGMLPPLAAALWFASLSVALKQVA